VIKESLLDLFDHLGSTRRGQRLLLKTVEVAQSSMGIGNYDDSLRRTGELKLVSALAQVLGPLTAIDIGAHHGAWSQAFRSNSARNRVIALEPDPISFGVLQAALPPSSNVLLINSAVSDKDGEQLLFIDRTNSQLSTLLPSMLSRVPESSRESAQAETSVHVMRLSSMLNEAIASGFIESLNDVNLIKVDTEGLEFPIMQQIIEEFGSRCPAIQFEFNSHALASGQLIDDFGQLLGGNFVLFRLAPRRLISRTDLSFSAANVAGFSNWVALHRHICEQVVRHYRRA
jgi:FkbM family methyltransferase